MRPVCYWTREACDLVWKLLHAVYLISSQDRPNKGEDTKPVMQRKLQDFRPIWVKQTRNATKKGQKKRPPMVAYFEFEQWPAVDVRAPRARTKGRQMAILSKLSLTICITLMLNIGLNSRTIYTRRSECFGNLRDLSEHCKAPISGCTCTAHVPLHFVFPNEHWRDDGADLEQREQNLVDSNGTIPLPSSVAL